MNLARRTSAWRVIAWLGLFSRVASSGPARLGGTNGSRAQALHAYANLPLRFVENRGQTDARVRYHAQGDRYAFYLTREEIVLSLAKRLGGASQADGITLALRFIGANPRATRR